MLESRAFRTRPSGGVSKCGAVAQLGERRVRNAKVEGSIPFRSTNFQGLTPPSKRGRGGKSFDS